MTATDILIAAETRTERAAETARRDARVASWMPQARTFALAVVARLDDEEVIDAISFIEGTNSGTLGVIAEELSVMDREQEDGWTLATLDRDALYALWQVGILAEEPESDALGFVRWSGFGSEASIRRAVAS